MNAQREEWPARTLPGLAMLVAGIVLLIVGIVLFGSGASAAEQAFKASAGNVASIVLGLLSILLGIVVFLGLFVVQPNKARVLILFGRYVGTVRIDGWHWANPFTVGSRPTISLRIRNFDTQAVKVNDQRGNPVEIAAVVAWRVVDTAKARFDVDDVQHYVSIQSETAVRHLATLYPYDSYEEGEVLSLSGNVDEVSRALQGELQNRLSRAGVDVVEARLSHLSYAPEIAGAMLRRQQANAIVAARQRMVEGAVGMVDMALQRLVQSQVVDLDDERKAAMISNLLVVLTGEQAAQPVINTGSLYS